MESRSVLRRNCQPGNRKICVSVVILAVIIGGVLLAYTAFGDKPNDPSLKKVFIVFRHGDRNPTETYANDPYVNYTWPDGWGALTKKGMRQMHTLGKWIDKEFGWLTTHKYLAENVVINSSYSDRCIMSTQAMLSGLYYEENAFVDNLPWRPIPVHYVQRDMDQILVVGKKCPTLDKSLKEAYATDPLGCEASLKSYCNELSRVAGQPMRTITDIEFLYNTLEIEVMNGLKLPEFMDKYYNDEMRTVAARSYAIFTHDKVQQRLRGGPLLKHILEQMKDGPEDKRMYLYGTHDINIVHALRAMGFTQELFKLDLGVTLVYELRAIEGGQSREVRVSMLNNTETTTLHRLNIPGCEEPCLLESLFNVWREVLPNDWDRECQGA